MFEINKKLIIASIICIVLGGLLYKSYCVYREYKIEMQRISHINKDDIDVKLYVDIADEVGHNDYQLNWREIVAIAGIKTNDYIKTIDENEIKDIANLFIDKEKGKVKSYEEVINSLNLDEKQIQRAKVYLDDLSTFGFMPDKYVDDSREMTFINSIKEQAIDSYNKYKILPSITIAQAILESSWGESNLTKEANNLFGIKADVYWKGEKVTFETKEFNDTYIMDEFRKYNDINESVNDHADFLIKNSRYKEAGVFEAKTYKEQAFKLQEAGYSTAEDENGNKTYANMLITIIKQYNLQLIDHETILNTQNKE